MSSSLFITGTDTDVGKTVITACLAAGRVGSLAVKPVASGVEQGAGEDAERLARAAGHSPQVFATYATPISPHRAAELEDAPLDVPGLLDWLGALEGSPLLVEGVGGWHVPISLQPRFMVPDLAAAVDAPVLVLSSNRLGTLNHTLLTVEAIQQAGFPVVGVVLNQAGPPDASSPYNLADLRRLLDVPVVPTPRVDLSRPQQMAHVGRELWQALSC